MSPAGLDILIDVLADALAPLDFHNTLMAALRADDLPLHDSLTYFRGVVSKSTPDRLQLALTRAGEPLDDDDAWVAWGLFNVDAQEAAKVEAHPTSKIVLEEIGGWLVATAGPLLHAAADDEAGQTGLSVDPAVARLPLLDLAADVARLAPSGRLSVRQVDLPDSDLGMGFNGVACPMAGAPVILLAPREKAADQAATFAHELAHLLDKHIFEVSHEGREAFARALGPLLLSAEPQTVDDAGPLIEAAEHATRSCRTTSLAGLVDSVVGQVRASRSLLAA